MNIPALSMAISSQRTAAAVNMSMMKKALDSTEQQGLKISEMIEGTTVDIKI